MKDIALKGQDELLSNIIYCLRQQSGEEFESPTVQGILGSIERHLIAINHTIYRDKQNYFRITI